MVRQFHDGMLTRGEYSEQIPVTTGDKGNFYLQYQYTLPVHVLTDKALSLK